MKSVKKFITGFTLIELLIVIAIIAILAIIAVPSYQTYTRKARFSEVIQATGPYKIAVENCYQAAGSPGTVSGCGAGSGGVPAAVTSAASGSAVAAVDVTSAGKITATAVNGSFGLKGETYIITPLVTAQGGSGANLLIWTASGTCVDVGYC